MHSRNCDCLTINIYPPARAWAGKQIRNPLLNYAFVALTIRFVPVKPPFCACIGDLESLALGIALRVAAGQRNDHREIAILLRCVAQASGEQSSLETLPPKFGNC